MKPMVKIAIAAILLAGCSASGAARDDDTSIRDAVVSYYAGYIADDASEADWAMPIYSHDTAQLIEAWRDAMADEPIDDLSSFGWLCECQDWDASQFGVEVQSVVQADGDHATVNVKVSQGWGSTVQQQLSLVRETDGWMLDDMQSESFPDGLKASLAEAARR